MRLLTVLCLLFSITAHAENKPVIAVLELKSIKVDKKLVKTLNNRVNTIINKSGRFKIINSIETNTALKEMNIESVEKCLDINCFGELGKSLKADKIFTGTIARIGHLYTIILKLINVEKQTQESRSEYDCECSRQMILRAIDEAVSGVFNLPYKGFQVVQKNNQTKNKPRIAVLSFEIGENVEKKTEKLFLNKIINIISASKLYRVVTRKQIETKIKKLKLSSDKCNSIICAVNLGQKLRVSKVITGKLYKVKNNYFASSQLIDIKTSKIINKADITSNNNLDYLLENTIYLTANLLSGKKSLTSKIAVFPVKEGYKGGTGSFHLTSNPCGAKIIIDNIKMNVVTPKTIENIPAGEHTIKIIKGATNLSQNININEGEHYNINFDLYPLRGKCKFLTTPNGAKIYFEDEFIGKTPFLLTDIKGGKYNITLELEDYNTEKFEIEITKESTLVIEKVLKTIDEQDNTDTNPKSNIDKLDNTDTNSKPNKS